MSEEGFVKRLKILHGIIVDSNEPVATGYHIFKKTHVDDDSDQQLFGGDLARTAFFAGAQHLFATIMLMAEEDAELTEEQIESEGLRVNKIQAELQIFAVEYRQRFMQLVKDEPEGSDSGKTPG